ncbi:hypothetical protein [Flavobacterium sp.]|uniref:hypothetical protein n=1 Tax=Flavobacterium sp. TaxID=239 RepID=UPI0037519F33
MSKKIIVTLLLLFNLNFYSQINFEKGYYVNNSNIKIECLIKNEDWNNSPTEFNYKLSENDITQTADIKNVKEFGVIGDFKYIRETVKYDISESVIDRLSSKYEPVFLVKTFFLKALIEGKANLYCHISNNQYKYFYSTDTIPVEELVHKKYLTEDNIRENNSFQNQILTNVKCETTLINEILKLDFDEKNLAKHFIKYNEFHKSLLVNYSKNLSKGYYKFILKAGVNFTSGRIDSYLNSSTPDKVPFKNKNNPVYGLEFEYVLPINKNKWGVFFESSYQKYESEGVQYYPPYYGVSVTPDTWTIKYESIALSLGTKYYMYLNKNSKFFLNVAFNTITVLDSEINKNNYFNLETDLRYMFSYGLGYTYKDRLAIEMKAGAYNVAKDYYYYKVPLSTVSLRLGYTIFNSKNK